MSPRAPGAGTIPELSELGLGSLLTGWGGLWEEKEREQERTVNPSSYSSSPKTPETCRRRRNPTHPPPFCCYLPHIILSTLSTPNGFSQGDVSMHAHSHRSSISPPPPPAAVCVEGFFTEELGVWEIPAAYFPPLSSLPSPPPPPEKRARTTSPGR